MNAPIIAASYERVSTRNQGRYGFSLGAQHQSLEEFTRAQGWALPEHLRFRDGEDEAASGADWDLPDLNRMLESARRREFQILAVPDLDRFARTLVKGLVLEAQLKDYGVRVVYQRVPVDDGPEGQLLKTQLFAFAEYERQKTLLRTMTGKRAKAQSGQVIGMGKAPYGLRFTHNELSNGKRRVCSLEAEPGTAPVARMIYDKLLYLSTADVAHQLNENGIPSPSGNRWKPDAVYRIGTDTVYMGQWLYGKNHRRVSPDDPSVIAVPVPALIDHALWDQVQTAIERRRVSRRGRVSREQDPYILRGMLTCGHCGGALHAHPNYGRYYTCDRHSPAHARRNDKAVCDLPNAHAVDLEAELWRILNATLLDPYYLAAGLTAGIAQHQDADRVRHERLSTIGGEIARLRKRLQAMVDELIDAGPESKEAIRRRMSESEVLISRLDNEHAELATLRREGISIDEASAIQVFASDVRSGLELATLGERRRLVELLDVRGTVFLDQEGIKLGRKHRYRIEWAARIPLRNSDGLVNNWVIHKISDAGVISSLKRSVSGIDDSLWDRLPSLAPGQAIVSCTHMQRPVLTSIDPTPAKLRMVE